MPDNSFNERIHDGYLRQPWNTFSSLFYSFVGIYIMCLPSTKKKAGKSVKIYENRIIKFLYAFSLVVTGLGSAFLHMSLTFVGQTTDVVGMYFISTFIILYAILRNKNSTTTTFVISMLLSNLILFIPLVFLPVLRRNLFAGLIVIGLIVESKLNKHNKGNRPDLLITCASIMIFGLVFWILDNTKLFFNPDSWFQGHGIWHLCGAISAWLLYYYYEQEKSLQ
jgi:hypothetical protein